MFEMRVCERRQELLQSKHSLFKFWGLVSQINSQKQQKQEETSMPMSGLMRWREHGWLRRCNATPTSESVRRLSDEKRRTL